MEPIECDPEIFHHWYKQAQHWYQIHLLQDQEFHKEEQPLNMHSSKGGTVAQAVNWVFAKLGTALCSAYLGEETWLLAELFREYWTPELHRWVEADPHRVASSRLVLWARPGSKPTAGELCKIDTTAFAGQNFKQLTKLLCGRLFQSTAE